MRPLAHLVVAALCCAAFPACATAQDAPPRPHPAEEVAVVETPLGTIAWRFLPEAAPQHVAFIKQLIRRGFYDGTAFHRVIPTFVIQGGDPNSKLPDRRLHGEGEAERRLAAEFSALHYRPGTVGLARSADPDSGSSQFFIALSDLPRLDGKYTIFGEVIEGLEVARRIALVPRDVNDNPLQPVTVKVRLERRELPDPVYSAAAGGASGETLTGPARLAWFDPRDETWQAPVPRSAPPVAPRQGRDPRTPGVLNRAAPRLDLALDETGRVLDVRFVDVATPDAARLATAARAWSFEPARRRGVPQRVRFEINADGASLGASTGAGAPLEPGPGVTSPPPPVIEVPLAPGTGARPPLRVRLLLGPDGAIASAALQGTTGDAALDTAAEEAARRLTLPPATRPGVTEPEPVAVYLDAEVRFAAPR